MTLLIILGVLLVVAVPILMWIIGTYNKIIVQGEMVENAIGQISVQQESRWDAIKSLMQATMLYQDHESETLIDVVERRSGLNKNSTVEDIEKDERVLEEAIRSVNVVVEKYPELKASELYANTMKSITEYEDKVKYSRMIFNDTVTKYNRLGRTFPNVLIANMLGHEPKPYFEVSEEKKEAPTWIN